MALMSASTRCRFHGLLPLVAFIACWSFSGCKPANESSGTPGQSNAADTRTDSHSMIHPSETPPRDRLHMVFQRYRNADAYEDRGEVELNFESKEQSETRRAPLSVWFNRGVLEVSAYGIRMAYDTSGSKAWFPPTVSSHSSRGGTQNIPTAFQSDVDWADQVLLGSHTGRRPNLEQLFADPVLVSQLLAGGAGPPPQLEWLFSAKPMAKLFDQPAEFRYVGPQRIGEIDCVGINVAQEADAFTFWIDEAKSLIRRIDLPDVSLRTESAPNARLVLKVHLDDASFVVKSNRPAHQDFPRSPRWVKSLVTPPPPSPNWIRWKLSDLGLVYQKQRLSRLPVSIPDDGFCVLVHLPNHEMSEQSAWFLDAWYRQMPPNMQRRVQLGLIDSEVHPTSAWAQGPPDSIQWIARPNPRSSADATTAGSVCVINSKNRVVWFQPSLDMQSVPLLGSVMADLTGGVDVPARVLAQSRATMAEFEKALNRVSVQP